MASLTPVLSMTPFPCAAQYYPEPHEFATDTGIVMEVYRCLECNLLQLGSAPVSYYKEVITAASFSAEARKARLSEISKFVDRFGLRGKNAIEVGSGKGAMLGILADAGLKAIGLENSVESVIFARQNGREMIQGYLNDLDEEYNERFDSFISLNYIEHQPDTKAFIRSLARITKVGAVGYVTAPNVNYLLKTNALYEFVADHLIYFTEETMRSAFEVNGFELLSSKTINNENDIALIVRKRIIAPIPGVEGVEELADSLSHFIDQQSSVGKKVAIWGAGHRTLALLTLAKITNISFIVDSADFKQGKYSPVMHTEIVSPKKLENSDVDIVIVMVPGLYPDEVVKTIRSFSRSFEIYKLKDNFLIRG